MPPTRQGFDDPEFFQAATMVIEPGRYELVVVDEWQTTSDQERGFIERLTEGSMRLVVQDSSRDLRPLSTMPLGTPERFELSTSLRSPDRIEHFDRAYVDERLEAYPARSVFESVRVTPLETLDDPQAVVVAALGDLRARGFAPSETGIVSCLGRTASSLVTAQVGAQASPRAFHQTMPQAMSALAADSFSYFLGLERRALLVVEASTALAFRRKKLHIALSRATEFVHLILPREDILADEVLSKWMEHPRP